MNPVQQAFPGPVELHLEALEQALADSQARERETQKQLDMLIIALEPVAGDGSFGKGVGGLGGWQRQVHLSTCPLHQATWSYW